MGLDCDSCALLADALSVGTNSVLPVALLGKQIEKTPLRGLDRAGVSMR
jgi:hypothetical protein